MAVYMVSYDLKAPGKNYDDLIKRLKGYPGWWHNLGSTWYVVSYESAEKIRDDLAMHVDRNDKLIVNRVRREAAWTGFNSDESEWLRNYLQD